MATIHPLVEGDIDAAIAERVIAFCGHTPGTVYGLRGAGYIETKIRDFNRSARGICYLAMVDLMDTRIGCAPEVVRRWLPYPEVGMHFRVVEREIESWILGDKEGLADFLGVSEALFDDNPDQIPNPKERLINIARRSNRRSIREAIVPAPRSTAAVGPQYNLEMREFVQSQWSPERARARSKSLDKCITRLTGIPR